MSMITDVFSGPIPKGFFIDVGEARTVGLNIPTRLQETTVLIFKDDEFIKVIKQVELNREGVRLENLYEESLGIEPYFGEKMYLADIDDTLAVWENRWNRLLN